MDTRKNKIKILSIVLAFLLLSTGLIFNFSCNEPKPEFLADSERIINNKKNTGHILFYDKEINLEKINKEYIENKFGKFSLSYESSNDSVLHYYIFIDTKSEYLSNYILEKYGIREIPIIWIAIKPYPDSSVISLSTQFFTDFNEDKFIPAFCSFPNNEIPIEMSITKKRDLGLSNKKYSVNIEYLIINNN